MKEVQCFAHLANVEDIPLEALPQLAYISKTVPESSVHPRVMHSHEDLCELVLIWEGEADYSIATDGMSRLQATALPCAG